MSLDREYSTSKIGATRKKAYTTGATVNVELVTYTSNAVFVPASFAVKFSQGAYVRQSSTNTAPADMTLEFEASTSYVWRVDVDTPQERYLHMRGISASGTVKITDISKVTGTSSDLG